MQDFVLRQILNTSNDYANIQRKELEKYLRDNKIFKDCLPTDDTIKLFEQCIDKLYLDELVPGLKQGNISTDFAQGYIRGINAILKRVKEYNSKAEQYGGII